MTISNRRGPIRSAAEHLFHMALRRALLVAAGNLDDPQARIDCAELALALDMPDEARLLFEVAFITDGYDNEALVAQEKLRRETLLWQHSELRPSATATERSGLQARIDGAAANLAACLAFEGQGSAASVDSQPAPQPSTDQDPSELVAGLAGLVNALHCALQGPLATAPLDGAIRALASHPLVHGSFTAREHVDAPIATLVSLFAAEAMRNFLRQVYVLFAGRLASPALVHRAGGFERSGLGPWFGHARYLVPDTRGLLGLAAAAQTSDDLDDALERGLVLLSTGLKIGALNDFVDILADEGLLTSLDLIAERLRTVVSASDRPLLWRLRDAAMDLDAPGLAIEMQTLLVNLSPYSTVEAGILAELQATKLPKGYGSKTGRRDLRLARQRARVLSVGCELVSDRCISVFEGEV